MKLKALLEPWVTTAIPNLEVSGLQNDSRKIKAGDVFLAYPGAAADGRLFIEQARQAGAVGIIYDSEQLPASFELPNNIPCVPLSQLGKKLAAIASRFFENPSQGLSVTGVTGTNGKTTIAYQLAQAYDLLGSKAVYMGTLGQGDVHALQSLANTTPDALCLQRCLHEYKKNQVRQLCMEVSSHALSQGRVEHIDFSQAIYTNLSLDHLDYHHTLQAYAEAKATLFAMPTLKSAIFNHDDEYSSLMSAKLSPGCQKLSYGLDKACDVRAVNWKMTVANSQFEALTPWGKLQIQINNLGKFNVYNSLAVLTGLLANGQSVSDVVDVMARLQAAPGRMEVVYKKPYVIVDYAHTPDALENVITTLLQLKQGRLIVVFGCGGDRDKTKRPIMGRIASEYADFVILTSDNPRSEEPTAIIADIAQGLVSNKNVLTCVDRKQAICEALSMVNPEDIILIAGKGHEDYQQIGKERFAFSDKKVVKELLCPSSCS